MVSLLVTKGINCQEKFRMGKKLKSFKNRQVSMVKVTDTPYPKWGWEPVVDVDQIHHRVADFRQSGSPVH